MTIYIKNIPKDIDVTKIDVGEYCFDTGDDMELRVKIVNRLFEITKGPLEDLTVVNHCPYRFLRVRYKKETCVEDLLYFSRYKLKVFNDQVYFDSMFASTVDKDFNIITTRERSKRGKKERRFRCNAYRSRDRIDEREWPSECTIPYCPCESPPTVSKNDPFRYQKFAEKYYLTGCCDRIVHKSCQDRRWKTLESWTCKSCRDWFINRLKPDAALFLDDDAVYNPAEHFDDEDITEY